MDILTIIVSAVASTLLTIPTMLVLYQLIIIPKMVMGVKKELPEAILSVVDNKISLFQSFLTEFIIDQIDRVKMSFLGVKSSKKKILDYALAFIEKNGVSVDTFDKIRDKYGQEAVDSVVNLFSQKKDENSHENVGGIVEVR